MARFFGLYLAAVVVAQLPSTAFANCYEFENHTATTQELQFSYTSPNPPASAISKLQIPALGKYPPDKPLCWDPGLSATVTLGGTTAVPSWNGLLVVGGDSNVAPSGTYALNAPTTQVDQTAGIYQPQLNQCNAILDSTNRLACQYRVQCLQDEAIALSTLQACKTTSTASCQAQQQRVDHYKTHSCDPAQAVLANAPPVRVEWRPHPPFDPNKYPLMFAAQDRDQDMPQFICEVELTDVHTHNFVTIVPGKLLNNNCNWAYGGGGTEAHSFNFAYLTWGEGYWAGPKADLSHALYAAHRPGSDGPFAVCRANYTEHTGYFNLFGVEFGSQDIDHGTHVGRLVGGQCHFEWGSKEIASDRNVEVYYLEPHFGAHPGTPAAPPSVAPAPPSHPPVAVGGCSLSPQAVSLGQSSTLSVILNQPAPIDGVGVSIDTNLNGAGATLVQTPVAFTFSKGATKLSQLLQTEAVAGAATVITFTAHIGNGTQCSTTLQIQ